MCNGCIIRCKVVSVGGQYSFNFFFCIISSSKQFFIVIRYATYDIIEPERIIAEGKVPLSRWAFGSSGSNNGI